MPPPSRVGGHRIRALLLPLLLVTATCDRDPSSPEVPGEVQITVLYTNDEHGWIEETAEAQGAARLRGLWREAEGYEDDRGFLVLSGGDNWTGPAISTWFQGASTVEVMNTMGYHASAIGNHEFDFTVDGLRDRIDEADYPYLSANIRLHGTGDIPDFATPFVIREVSGVRVGLVGLTTLSTPYSTFPTNVSELDFVSYVEALADWVPQAREAGAELILVVGHICHTEMLSLTPAARELGVSMIGGGHCNERVAELDRDVALIQAGWQMGHYAKLEIGFDLEASMVRSLVPSYAANVGGSPDPAVDAVVRRWQAAAAAELSETIGYAEQSVPRTSPAMHNLVTDSWLYAYPNADIAMTNAGGIRQSIPAGEITRGAIIGVLPFQNSLVEVELTGSEVVECLGDLIIAGMTALGGYRHPDGTPLEADNTYGVLTTDYLYARDDHCFSTFDDSPYHTGLSYHQPTIDYVQSLTTSPSAPLDSYLDPSPRR
jgi:2',3'-cyclic-nucleotide 2'-phosphodiesterase (5'-nucleotidase family)